MSPGDWSGWSNSHTIGHSSLTSSPKNAYSHQTASKPSPLGLRAPRRQLWVELGPPEPVRPTGKGLSPRKWAGKGDGTAVVLSVSVKSHFVLERAGDRAWALESPGTGYEQFCRLPNAASLTLGPRFCRQCNGLTPPPHPPEGWAETKATRPPRAPAGLPAAQAGDPRSARPASRRLPTPPARPLTGRHGDPEPRSPPRTGSAGPRRPRRPHHDTAAPGPEAGTRREVKGGENGREPRGSRNRAGDSCQGRPSSAPDDALGVPTPWRQHVAAVQAPPPPVAELRPGAESSGPEPRGAEGLGRRGLGEGNV